MAEKRGGGHIVRPQLHDRREQLDSNAADAPHRASTEEDGLLAGLQTSTASIRRTRVELDIGALRRNYRGLRKLVSGTAILAIVKANAYGHGAVTISHILEQEGAEWLGVALIEEGIQLRKAGIQLPILVLSGSYAGGYEAMLEYGLIPAVFSEEHLIGLAKAGRPGEKVRAHLKVDTGMGRLGVWPSALKEYLRHLEKYPSIEIEGLLSHFANADLADAEMTARQVQGFQEALAQLRSAGLHPRWRHLSNSAGVLLRSDIRALGINLARPGIALYGVNPTPGALPMDLAPVLAWKTEIIHLKRVPAGTPISYGGTWKAPQETAVATLPVGYADGYFRGNSNKAEVLVRGRRAPIIGRVCMDLCMADVSQIQGAQVGDEVVLLGSQGDEEISAAELAAHAGTIPYEVLCAISARVPRISHPTSR